MNYSPSVRASFNAGSILVKSSILCAAVAACGLLAAEHAEAATASVSGTFTLTLGSIPGNLAVTTFGASADFDTLLAGAASGASDASSLFEDGVSVSGVASAAAVSGPGGDALSFADVFGGGFLFLNSGATPATIMLSLDFALDAAALSDPSESALALASLEISGDPFSIDGQDAVSFASFGPGDSASALGIALLVDAGAFAAFDVDLSTTASATTPVPLPGAIWLLASGLTVLAALRRAV